MPPPAGVIGDLEARASVTFLWPPPLDTHGEYRHGRRRNMLDDQPAI